MEEFRGRDIALVSDSVTYKKCLQKLLRFRVDRRIIVRVLFILFQSFKVSTIAFCVIPFLSILSCLSDHANDHV